MSCAECLPDARAWMVCRAEGKRWYTKAPLPRAFPSATAVACPGNLTPVKAVNRPKVAPATVKAAHSHEYIAQWLVMSFKQRLTTLV